jgi:hypothetical protein
MVHWKEHSTLHWKDQNKNVEHCTLAVITVIEWQQCQIQRRMTQNKDYNRLLQQ